MVLNSSYPTHDSDSHSYNIVSLTDMHMLVLFIFSTTKTKILKS